MNFSFSSAKIVSIPIHRSDTLFPVNHIYCIGRNYSSHAREMGADTRKPPFFFSKPSWTISRGDLEYPIDTEDLQHEVELVLAVGADLSIFGYGVGVDLTKRDIQRNAKKEGKPWFSGKSFAGSSTISDIVPNSESIDFSTLSIQLEVNGKIKQSASCLDMIWSPKKILRKLQVQVPLSQGDLIFTGTPEGVGSLFVGDSVVATIPDKIKLSFCIQ